MIRVEYFMEYRRKWKVVSDVLLAGKFKWRTKEYCSYCSQKLKAFFKSCHRFVN